MKIKLKLKDIETDGKEKLIEKTVSYSEFKAKLDGEWWDSFLYISHEMILEENDIPKVKQDIKRESYPEFIERMKLEKPKCKGKNCTKLGYHFGVYCTEHFNTLRKYLDQKGISFKDFEKKYLKK